MYADNNPSCRFSRTLPSIFIGFLLFVWCKTVSAHGGVEIDHTPDRLLLAYVTDNPISNSVVMVVPGTKPALMVKHEGTQTLKFINNDQAWLSFSNEGVFANQESPNWQYLTEAQTASASPLSAEEQKKLQLSSSWKKLKNQPQLTFLEPVIGQATDSMTWLLPVQLGEEELNIAGIFNWQKIAKVKNSAASH